MTRIRAGAGIVLMVSVASLSLAAKEPPRSVQVPPATATGTASAAPCAGAGTQLEATTCWGKAAKEAEGALADEIPKVEAVVRVKAGDDGVKILRQAQAAWERYRDAECALQSKRFQGGSAESMAALVCRWRMATDRATVIRTDRKEWAQE